MNRFSLLLIFVSQMVLLGGCGSTEAVSSDEEAAFSTGTEEKVSEAKKILESRMNTLIQDYEEEVETVGYISQEKFFLLVEDFNLIATAINSQAKIEVNDDYIKDHIMTLQKDIQELSDKELLDISESVISEKAVYAAVLQKRMQHLLKNADLSNSESNLKEFIFLYGDLNSVKEYQEKGKDYKEMLYNEELKEVLELRSLVNENVIYLSEDTFDTLHSTSEELEKSIKVQIDLFDIFILQNYESDKSIDDLMDEANYHYQNAATLTQELEALLEVEELADSTS